MGKQRPTASPATPSWAGLLFTGKPAMSSTMATANGDDGKNDVGLVAGLDQNEVRAYNQTPGEKVRNGLIKLGGTALTSFAEPFADILVGLPAAGITAAQGGDAGAAMRATFDNGATQALDSFNEYLQQEFPHYYSQKEQNMSLLGQAGTLNFWADKVGNGAGFMLGAIASGALTGGAADALKAGRIAKGVATAAELAADVTKGAQEGGAILNAVGGAAKSAGRSALGRNLLTGVMGSLGESGMEGRQIAKDTGIAVRKQLLADKGMDPNAYEDYAFTPQEEAHIKDLEEAAGNVGFGINMVLTGVENALLLPKVFRKGYQAERVALGAIEGSMETGYKAAEMSTKRRLLKTAGKVLLNNVEEATQEQLQYAVEQGMPDYFKKQRDPQATTDLHDMLASAVTGMGEAYGTKAGWENALLGGIIGLAGAHTSLQEVGAEHKTTLAAVDALNASLQKKPQQAAMRALVGVNAFHKVKTEAVRSNDEKAAHDAAFGEFSTLVRAFSQAGKLEDLKEQLQKTGELTPEEFKELNGFADHDVLPASPAAMAAKQVQKAEQLHKLSEQVEAAYPGDGLSTLRDAFYGIASQVQDHEGRERQLANELAKDTGISLDALTLTDQEHAHQNFKEAVEKWANAPGRLGMMADSAIRKANDLQDLAQERIRLAGMYKALEDPKHRETLFAAADKLRTLQQEQEAKAKAEAAAAPKAAAPTTTPTPGTAPVAAAAADTADDDDEEANTGAFGQAMAAKAAGTPAAVPNNQTPVVALGSEKAFATLNPDGSVASYTQLSSMGGNRVHKPGSKDYEFAHKDPAMQAAVMAQKAAMAAQPAAPTAPAAAQPAAPVAPAPLTDAQTATIAQIEDLKAGSPSLNEDGSLYVVGEDKYGRATGLKKKLLSPRTNSALSAEDIAASDAFLKDNPQYAHRGNVADLVIREYFLKGGALTLDEAKAVYQEYAEGVQKRDGKDALSNLSIADTYLQGILDSAAALKAQTDKLGWHILSDVATLHGTIGGEQIAGTVDLLAILPDGSVNIIDVKTNESSRNADYKKKDLGQGTDVKQGSSGKYVNDESRNREGDLIQQATYEELLKQRVPGIKVAGRYIFPIVTKAKEKDGVFTYDSANLETQIGKGGLASITIHLNAQTSVGQDKVYELGKMDINGLMAYYGGTPGKAASKAEAPVTFYASNAQDGILTQGKNMLATAAGFMPLQVTVSGDKATASINPSLSVKQLLDAKLGTLEDYFEPAPGVLDKEVKAIVASSPAILERDGNTWKVGNKGILLIQYADGTDSNTKAAAPEKKAAVAAPVEDKEPIGPEYFSRLAGLHPNSWVSATDKAEQPRRDAWVAAMKSGSQRAEPVFLRVEAGGKQFNVYTKLDGKLLKLGYLAPTTTPLDAGDSNLVHEAKDQAIALKEAATAYAAAHPGQDIPLTLRVNSLIDSVDNRTDKPLSQLDDRFKVSDGKGGLHHEVVELRGQYREAGGQQFTNAFTGGGVRRSTSEELAAANITSRYAMRVQAPGGEYRWIGVNTAPLTDEKVFANIQTALAGKATEKEKARFLNALVFLSHKGPYADGAARPGIRFIGSDKGTVSAKVFITDGTQEDGNPKDTITGYLRFTAKAHGNTSADFLNALTYFPVGKDGKETGEKLPATEVVGAVRSQLLDHEEPAERLAKLVPSTSEQLWTGVQVYPTSLAAPQAPAPIIAEKAEQADAIATPLPSLVSPKAATAKKTRSFAKPDTDSTVPMKVRPRTAEVLESEDFKAIEDYVAKNLPEGPEGFSVHQMVEQVLEGGTTVGYALDRSIFLATSAPKGTGYHEAFHGVFRVLLNAAERQAYYNIARRNTDLSEKAKNKFRRLHPQYARMSEQRLEQEMLEERMADLFADHVLGKTVPMRTLFQRIQAYLKWLFSGGERPVHQQLRELFAKIDGQGFKNSTYRDINDLGGARKTLHFLNAYESERAVRLLTGDFVRLKEQMGDSMSDEEILEDILDTRKLELAKDSSWVTGDQQTQEAQLKQRNYYRATTEDLLDGETAGKLYPMAFADEEDRQSLKEEIKKQAANLARAEALDDNEDADADTVVGNDADDASERSFDMGQLQVENKPGKQIKEFILYTTYVDAAGVRQVVDYKSTVDLLYRILDNTRTFADMYRAVRTTVAGGNQTQLAAVLENITSQLATQNAPYFQDQFRNAFYRIYADPRVTTLNAETGKARRFAANRESTELKLMASWREAVEGKAGDQNALRKAITTFNKVRTTLNASDSTIEERHRDEVQLVEALGAMGVDLSSGLVRNALDGTDSAYTWGRSGDERRSLEEDLVQLSTQLFAGTNPFLRTVDEKEGEQNKTTTGDALKKGEGAISRALALATADARYRQDVVDASGQDAAGKPYFARAQPAYLGERARDIQDGTYHIAGKPWLAHNLVARYEKGGAAIRNVLRLNADLGIREENTEEGLTPKDKDPKTYWLEEAANFRGKKGSTLEREITPFQLEAKSSSATLTIPTYAPGFYYKDGALTEQALEDLYYMGYQDLVNGELALKQLYGMNPIAPIEGTHFLKKPYVVDGKELLPGGYDEHGQPRLIDKATILEYQNSGRRDKLPRIFQVVSLPSLNKLTNEQLRNKATVLSYLQGDSEQGVPSFVEELMDATRKQLTEVGLDIGDPVARRLLMGPDSGYKDINEFLGDLVMTNLLWSDAYFRLMLGSEAWFGGHVDATKRMALLIAAGPSMGEGRHRFAALETHESYLDAKTLLPITKEQYQAGLSADKKNNTTTVRKADATDAQVYWTADMAKRFYQGIGKLTGKTATIYDKVIAGESLTAGEQKLLLDEGVSLISAKGVYASQQGDGSVVYLKFSAHILSPELTSFKDKDGNWHAKPDMEGAHNLRNWMAENRLDAAGHDTSFKVGLRNKNFRDATGNYSGEAGFVELDNNGLREQMQNPSGKRKIVYPTQVLQLLDEGMQDSEQVELDGEVTTIGAIRDTYQGLFADVRQSLMEDAQIAAKAVVSGNRLLVGQIVSTLEASGAGPAELAFFQQHPDKPEFLHSTDLPSLAKRFQKLFLAHYNKGALSLKAPGSKYTLVTSGNTRVAVGPDGELAHDWGKEYHEQDYWTADFKLKEGYTTRELHMHGPESSEPGAPIRLAEVYLSEELLLRAGDNGMTRQQLYALPEETRNAILTQLGVRIPFQSHHSAMPFKVVGWLPAHYGSVVIAPAAITTLSGADYDIDSLYVLRKEFWQSKDQNWHVYGEGLSETYTKAAFAAHQEKQRKHIARELAERLGKKELSAQDEVRYADRLAAVDTDYASFRKAAVSAHAYAEYKSASHSNKTLGSALRAVRDSAEWQQASRDIEEAGKLLGKDKKAGVIKETQQAVEPLLRAIRNNLWAVNDETAEGQQKLEQATDQLLALAVGHTLISNKLKAALASLDALRHEAHKQVQVAYTKEEFTALTKAQQTSTYATYGKLMDSNLALMRNPHNAESIVTPAEVQPLQDAVDAFKDYRSKESGMELPYSSLTVRSSHQFNNLVGKANIGPAALANTVSALLTKHRYNFAIPFYFMGQPMKGYASNLEDDIHIDGDGKVTIVKESGRKANSLSTLVSAMADNAKERLAAKLNLTRDNLMALANLVSMGYGLQRTMLFAAQPAMELLSQRYRASMSIADKNASQDSVIRGILDDIDKRLKSGKPAPGEGLSAPKQRAKKEVVAEAALTLKELRRELSKLVHPDKANAEDEAEVAKFTALSQRVNAAYDAKDLRALLALAGEVGLPLSAEQQAIADEADSRGITAAEIADALENQVTDLSFDLRGALKSLGALSVEHYDALQRQRDILLEYAALLEQTKSFKAVSTILSGNKGVGSDFTGLSKIGLARQRTTMPVDSKGRPMPAEGGIYLDTILRKEHGLRQNLANIDELEAQLPEYFISRTGPVQDLVATISGLMPGAKEEDLLNAELDANTFLGINAYQVMGESAQNGYRLANFHGLFASAEDNLGKKLEQLRQWADTDPQLYGWLKRNLFLRNVTIRKPEGDNKLYGISFNTRQKVSPEFAAKLDESVRELMGPAMQLARDFMRDSLRYLAAKDNFQFKNGTFVGLMPEIQFRNFSKNLKEVHQSLLHEDGDLKNLTGYNAQGLRRQFLYTWFTNPAYRKKVLGLAGTEGKNKYGPLSDAFQKTPEGLYFMDVMTLPEKLKAAAAGLKRFPPVVAVNRTGEGPKILMLHSFPKDKGGQVVRGQAFYEEVPELKWNERAYYHLNKVELAKEAAAAALLNQQKGGQDDGFDAPDEGPEDPTPTPAPKAPAGTTALSKLPSYVPGQKTMTYAGIGSRTTPPEMLRQMPEIAAHLQEMGYTLQSGGAEGADKAFEAGAGAKKTIFYSKDGLTHPLANALVDEVHPNPRALQGYVRGLMARNAFQVFGKNLDTPVDFVLAWTPDGVQEHAARTQKTGGTGQAISLASLKGIPVINLAKAGWQDRLNEVLDAKPQPAEWRDEPGIVDSGTATAEEEALAGEDEVGAFGTSLGMKPATKAAAEEEDDEEFPLNGGAFGQSLGTVTQVATPSGMPSQQVVAKAGPIAAELASHAEQAMHAIGRTREDREYLEKKKPAQKKLLDGLKVLLSLANNYAGFASNPARFMGSYGEALENLKMVLADPLLLPGWKQQEQLAQLRQALTAPANNSAVTTASAEGPEMTPYVKDLLDNWETVMQPGLHVLSLQDRMDLAEDLEAGRASTTCFI